MNNATTTKKPNTEQKAAVLRFATAYGHGRQWKAQLRACWERSRYLGVTSQEDAAILQGVRNQLGPSWLARVTLAQLRDGMEAAKPKMYSIPETLDVHDQVSPFPMAGTGGLAGKFIVEELCRCGHIRGAHQDTVAYGHGECAQLLNTGGSIGKRCRCQKFTWDNFITAEAR